MSWTRIDIVAELNKCERDLVRSLKSERMKNIVDEEEDLEAAPIVFEEDEEEEETTSSSTPSGTGQPAGIVRNYWLFFKYIKDKPQVSPLDGNVVYITPVGSNHLTSLAEAGPAVKQFEEGIGQFGGVEGVIQFGPTLTIGIKDMTKSFYVLGVDDWTDNLIRRIATFDFHARFEACSIFQSFLPTSPSMNVAGAKVLTIRKK